MSTFVSRTNPVTGKLDWIVQNDNYDFHQEVARSAYADMLHDTERNQMYNEALRRAVIAIHKRGERACVLDIGTGTGLLSMMAARCGADIVVACEAFRPMAECAAQVIRDNGLADRIKLVAKRSTELTVGIDGDLSERANILVTEVFDTELIGEGALGTFQHAHTHLLQHDCIVIPSSATVYAQVVTSPFFRRCNRFEPIHLPNGQSVFPPSSVNKCPGAAAVHDLQLDQVTTDMFTPITHPMPVFSFDFSGRDSPAFHRHSETQVKALSGGGGRCDAVFMWWELEMGIRGELTLSTAPRWAHPTPLNMQWRDHWMQAIYYPVTQLEVKADQTFTLHSFHDEYSLWFDVSCGKNGPRGMIETPACTCGAHLACCRTRMGMLNDPQRNDAYVSALAAVVKESTVCLCLGDACLLPLIVAKLGAAKVYTVENNILSRRMIESFIATNNLQSDVVVINKPFAELSAQDINSAQINLLVGEPFFSSSTLPWHNLHFLYARSELGHLLANDCTILPATVCIKAIVVEFENLCKIRSPVDHCEGFNLSSFDTLIENASAIADAYMEPHPLWEYPARPFTATFDLLQLNLTKSVHGVKRLERDGTVELTGHGRCNGVAVWMEYRLDMDHSVSGGLLAPPVEGQPLRWDPHTRQAVHLFKVPVDIDSSNAGQRWCLKHRTVFTPRSGDIDFEFSLIPAAEV
jgi:protein arginine N-methyltransferase 7